MLQLFKLFNYIIFDFIKILIFNEFSTFVSLCSNDAILTDLEET